MRVPYQRTEQPEYRAVPRVTVVQLSLCVCVRPVPALVYLYASSGDSRTSIVLGELGHRLDP